MKGPGDTWRLMKTDAESRVRAMFEATIAVHQRVAPESMSVKLRTQNVELRTGC